MNKVDPVLHDQIKQLIDTMGFEFFGAEMVSDGGQKLFRVYIEKPVGVTIEDCVAVSRQLSAMMDVMDPITNEYRLEVSSPGIDRPLFELAHFQRYIGKQIKVQLYAAGLERRRYKGTLTRVDSDAIYLSVDEIEDEVKLPLSSIEKSNLIGEFRLTK